MSTQWIAIAGVAAIMTALASPAMAQAPSSGTIGHLRVIKSGNRCVQVMWSAPVNDSGDPYGVIIRTRRGDEVYRVETRQTYTQLCQLRAKTYHVLVKQYGYGSIWSRRAVRFR